MAGGVARAIAAALLFAVATATPAIAHEEIGLSVADDGVRLVLMKSGHTDAILFGTSRADTLAGMVTQGKPVLGTSAGCSAGPMSFARYPGGPTLEFQHGRFVGWSADKLTGRGVTTMNGIGPGSTRVQLDQAYVVEVRKGPAGVRFSSGALGGLLDGPGRGARIIRLWGGSTCLTA